MYKKNEVTMLKFTKEELGIINNIAKFDCTGIDCDYCECKFHIANKAEHSICFQNFCIDLLKSLEEGGIRK